MGSSLKICADNRELARTAAKQFVAQASDAIKSRDKFAIAFSGGTTPKLLYQLLADPLEPYRAQLSWKKIHCFWTDERPVLPDHPDSNYRMVNEALLSHVPVPQENVHRIESELQNPAAVANSYEATIKAAFSLGSGALPQFDLILLGLGKDGHTASLFPDSDVIRDQRRLVAAPWVEQLKSYRFTLTFPVLNAGRFVLFLVSGEEKAATLRAVMQSERDPERIPAQGVNPSAGEMLWLVDQAAAGRQY